jgi:hypothetical protein
MLNTITYPHRIVTLNAVPIAHMMRRRLYVEFICPRTLQVVHYYYAYPMNGACPLQEFLNECMSTSDRPPT